MVEERRNHERDARCEMRDSIFTGDEVGDAYLLRRHLTNTKGKELEEMHLLRTLFSMYGNDLPM